MRKITFKIESRLDATPLLGQMVNALCSAAGLSPTDAGFVEVSVVEAANNAIEHAYLGDPNNFVEVSVSLAPDALIFDVFDSGKSADPDFVHSNHQGALSLSEETLAHASERGRGLAIIQQVMDSIEYTPGSGRNRFRLIKRLRAT
ncbi:MAG TPA: ATP-binding protein [Candidatus Angelobacter sp.]|nr:ATP-binding protein [Candidatus Angelobacter sp.]